MKPTSKSPAILFTAVAVFGGALFLYLAIERGPATTMHATRLPQPVSLPEFSLIDQHGVSFDRDSLRGSTTLVFFGFTNCPDVCPATLSQLAMARRAYVDEFGERDAPRILLVSVDPERDTPEAMAAYVPHFGTGVTGVTGSVDEILRLTSAVGVYFARSGDGDAYNVDHSTAVLVVDRNAQFVAVFGAPHSVDAFAADLPLLTEAG